MPYNKSTQKDYGENPLQKKSSFTMKSGNSPLFKQMGSSPVKQNVFDKEGRSDLDPITTIQQAASGRGSQKIRGKSAWQVRTEQDKPRYGTSYGESMDASKKTLGRGISNFFGKLKSAGRKAETDASKLAKTDVPRKFAKDVKKTAKKIFGKKARGEREAWQIHKNVGTKYEGMNSFEKRMAKKAEAR
tara:strand:+ start:172 stop:735 length:564 start_codon:yes stop_codon:yes gene_type:complete